jgi:hypothetical protein
LLKQKTLTGDQVRDVINRHHEHMIQRATRRSHDAVIRVYDEAGNVIDTHEHKGEFKEW